MSGGAAQATIVPQTPHRPVGGTSTKQSGQTGRGRSATGVGRGARGAREVPYRATGLSWHTPVPGISVVLLETMRQQLQGVDPEQIAVTWLGLRLNAEHRAELDARVQALATEFKDRGPDPDGDAYSLVMVTHPDLNPSPPGDDPSARRATPSR